MDKDSCNHPGSTGRARGQWQPVLDAFCVALMFVLLISLLLLDETIDIPHLLLGAPRTPVNWHELTIEMFIVVLVGTIVVTYLVRLFSARMAAERALQASHETLESLVEQRTERLKVINDRLAHLNLVLRTVRNVNQLIIKERDRDRLLQRICDLLVKDRGYCNAWIALFDNKQRAIAMATSGLGASAEPMAERLRRGELTHCAREVLGHGEVIIKDPNTECADCPLASEYSGRTGVSVRLEHEGEVYGLISMSVPPDFAEDEEERSLFREVAGDIALVLHIIEVDELGQRTVEKLHESESMYRNLVSNLTDVVMEIDSEGKFTYVSPQMLDIFGYTPEESVGLDAFSFVHPDDISQCMEAMANTDEVKMFEYRSRHKDGHYVDVSITGKIAPDGCGGTKNISVARDITERKKAEKERTKLEQQLRQQQKLESTGTLAGGVAHEINNPINGIINYAQLIGDRLEETSPLKEYTGEIIKESERVTVIVRNLLAFSRDEKQTHSPAEISDVVENTLSLMRTVLIHDQIAFEVDVPDDLPRVKCRSQQIQQVLMNLLTNARDALNERHPGHSDDKILSVMAREYQRDDRRWLRLTVDDRGAGIPLEIRDRVFDPFFTTKKRDKGTGLGLAISYGIVKDHHGDLTFESEQGSFTRFHLDLPIDNGWSIEGGSESRIVEENGEQP